MNAEQGNQRFRVAESDRVHHYWDAGLEPLLRVSPGDTVDFDLRMSGEGQVLEDSRIEDVTWDFDTVYNLAGPIWIDGAQPGDTLEIRVLDLRPGDWGWTAVIPSMGLLPEDFPEPLLRTFDLRDGESIQFADGIRFPQRPFLGVMGVVDDRSGQQSPFPPHKGGGNLDNRHIGVGTSLFLPIWREGGLFSCGDAHASQGDGEVCVSAVECGMHASLEFHLHHERTPSPMLRRSHVHDPLEHGETISAMGTSEDLFEASQIAVRSMVEWLSEKKGISSADAYLLSSLVGDLRIHEIVNAGTWNVGFVFPLAVFEE